MVTQIRVTSQQRPRPRRRQGLADIRSALSPEDAARLRAAQEQHVNRHTYSLSPEEAESHSRCDARNRDSLGERGCQTGTGPVDSSNIAVNTKPKADTFWVYLRLSNTTGI